MGDTSKETWRGLSDSAIPEASGVTPDTCQEDSYEGGTEEFSVLSPGTLPSMIEASKNADALVATAHKIGGLRCNTLVQDRRLEYSDDKKNDLPQEGVSDTHGTVL